MCRSLQDKGHETLIAFRKAPRKEPETVGKKIAEYRLNGTDRFALDRYFGLQGTLHDLFALPRFLYKEEFDILHMHLSHDHALGAICAKMLGKKRPALIRSLHRRSVVKATIPYRLLLKRLTDAHVLFTESFREKYTERFSFNPELIGVQPMTVDLGRFKLDRDFQDMRSEFGIPEDATAIGIVGRFQKYRRMDVFLKAAARVLQQAPNTYFVVIGRSSQIQETVINPMKKLGLSDKVILTGYRIDDYDDTLACLDIFSLLIPGFDGTARAVREAMALGKCCVVSDCGMLPEIIRHEETGLVASLKPDSLADNWLRVIEDKKLRGKLGKAANNHARQKFSIDEVGPMLEEFYEKVLRHRQGRG